MEIGVVISRASVMGIVEGISVTISLHNGGSPTFEELWASESEQPKLDIYYREGISTLERNLEHWAVKTSDQFDLQAIGEDYSLQLKVNDRWPKKVTGLLKNKVQDYLVHTVTAGWLKDFTGIESKVDYVAAIANDLKDIIWILGLRDLSVDEGKRHSDDAEKDSQSIVSSAGKRHSDDTEKDSQSIVSSAGKRHSDDADVCVRRDWTDWSGKGHIIKIRHEREKNKSEF